MRTLSSSFSSCELLSEEQGHFEYLEWDWVGQENSSSPAQSYEELSQEHPCYYLPFSKPAHRKHSPQGLVFDFFFFWGRVSLYSSPQCPGTHPVDQDGLKLGEIRLPLPPKHWDYRYVPWLPTFVFLLALSRIPNFSIHHFYNTHPTHTGKGLLSSFDWKQEAKTIFENPWIFF